MSGYLMDIVLVLLALGLVVHSVWETVRNGW